MWLIPVYIFIIGLLTYLTLATVYLLMLAVAYFLVREPEEVASTKLNRFAILVPAYNEELLISRLCESLLKINYPEDLFEIFIVADNCNDGTAEICGSFPVNVLTRNDPSRIGKGFAISWALAQIPLENFDAVFILDADNVVDPGNLRGLNNSINRGEVAIQCNNSVGNRTDSWFTQLLFVSRTIGNLLYHHSKYKLGLSSYLMGNGLCFTASLLGKRGWTAFSAGEDWEYYTQLIEDGIKIGFAAKAKVYHQESQSLEQATSQRLRWSSGRFKVLSKYGLKLFWEGLRKRDLLMVDASLPLVFPNYSLQINLTILTAILCLCLPSSPLRSVSMWLSLALICGQLLLFLSGVYLAGSYLDVFKAVLHAPAFLVWKLFIDILSFSGIYRGEKWIRTERHLPR